MAREELGTDEIARRAGGGVVGLTVRYGFGFLLNLAGITLAARALGDEAFGTHFTLPLMLVHAAQLLSYGVWATIVQRPEPPSRALLETGFTLQLLLGLAVAGVVAGVVAPEVAARYGEPRLVPLCRAAALGGLFTCVRWYMTALAERRLEYRRVGIAELADLLAFNVVLVAGVLADATVTGLLVAFATRGLPSSGYLAWRERPSLRPRLDRTTLAAYRRFGLPFLAVSVLQITPVLAAPFVASLTLAAPTSGLVFSTLALAYRLLEMPRVLVTIAYRLGLSVQSRLAGDEAAFARSLRFGLRVLLAVLTPVVIGMGLLAPLYVRPLFGDEFAATAETMRWLAPAFVLNAAWMYLATAVAAAGAIRRVLVFYAGYNALLWALVLGLVPRAPLLGLPWAELVAALLGFVLLRGAVVASAVRVRDVLEPVAVGAGALVAASTLGYTAPGLSAGAAFGVVAAYCAIRYRSLAEPIRAHLFRRGDVAP